MSLIATLALLFGVRFLRLWHRELQLTPSETSPPGPVELRRRMRTLLEAAMVELEKMAKESGQLGKDRPFASFCSTCGTRKLAMKQ